MKNYMFLLVSIALLVIGCYPAPIATSTPSPTPPENRFDDRFENFQTDTPTPGVGRRISFDTCRVTTGYPLGSVNMREGPGLAFKVIEYVYEAEVMTINQADNGWLNTVSRRHVSGWIYSKFCEVYDE